MSGNPLSLVGSVLAVGGMIWVAMRKKPLIPLSGPPAVKTKHAPPVPARVSLPEFCVRIPLEVGAPSRPVDVRSYSDPSVTYIVDVGQRTCTCPDFVGKRAPFPADDARRVCKHQYSMLAQSQLLAACDEVTQVIVHHARFKEHYFRATLASGKDFIVGATAGEPWLDVFARTRLKGEKGGVYSGRYEAFGLNVAGNRWSYGDGPPGAMEIKQIIRAAGLPIAGAN